MSEEKLSVTRMTFFDIMSNTMYVYGTENEESPITIEEVCDCIRSLAQLVERSKK